MTEKQHLTLTETASYVSVPRRTLYAWIKTGQFPVLPIPGTSPRRWHRSDLDRWLIDPASFLCGE